MVDNAMFEKNVDEAIRVTLEAGRASITLLQRKLNIGYGAADRIMDEMERRGIVSEQVGTEPREILITLAKYISDTQANKIDSSSADDESREEEEAETEPQAVERQTALLRIEERLKDLPEECTRAKALRAVQNFRRSWLSLGEHLCEVAYGGDFKEWGYESFEDYCRRELGLKVPTVKKLIVSYNYMTRNCKQLVDSARNGEATPPEYQTVVDLCKARDRDDVDPDRLREIEARAISGEADERELRKELRSLCEGNRLPGMQRGEELRRLISTARNLERMIKDSKVVPDGLRLRLQSMLVEIEELE
jgi:DNA-binding MarR family transcriptional regulator